MATGGNRYRAFISYRHVERDRRWARWLVEQLETFHTPKALVRAGAPLRVGHLFRDDDEIPASSDLTHQIEDALAASQFLIVVCSKDTPKSQWVRREIEFFRKLGRADRILALLVDGEPAESFPPELLHVFGGSAGEIEREPIAADVRPRRDERKPVTERRALLRIAAGLLGVGYDDLARREHQRRVRRQRLQAAIAATILLIAGGSLYAYWDHNRVKVNYFAAIGTRWGQPFGIHPLDGKTAAHRAASYALFSQRGYLTGMKRINGSGTLVAFDGDDIESESHDGGVAEIRIPFPADRVAEMDYYNAAGRLLRMEKITWLPNGTASVALTDAGGGAQALSINKSGLGFGADDGRRSQISQYGLTFDSEGRLVKRLYLSVWGMPIKDFFGSFGRIYSYTPTGQIASFHELDGKGATLTDRTGIAAISRNYDDLGQTVSIAWRNAAGHLTMNSHGYAELKIVRDRYGNFIRDDYYGPDGKLVQRSDKGYASLVSTYDEAGNRFAYIFLSAKGKPILAKDTDIARGSETFDAKGQPIAERYFDLGGRPALSRDHGVAGVVRHFDGHGDVTGLDYFGTDDKPILERQLGVAHERYKYDQNGNLTEAAYFGLDDAPTFTKDLGVARVVNDFDNRNLLIARRYFGIDGKQIAARDTGIAQFRWSYDERGNMEWERDFGADGAPALNKTTGAAAIKNVYDEHGDRTELDYFGVDGRPILEKEGYARITATIDERGNTTEQDLFGTDGRPVENAKGMARITMAYDQSGNNTAVKFFDAGNRPTLVKDGNVAAVTQDYDTQGNVLAMHYFGIDGRPTLWQPGRIATERHIFDDRGNIVETDFFGIDGKPAPFVGQNCARETIQYDDRNNPVEEACYGADGKPSLRGETGAARSVERFNARNEVIERRLFGTDGKPINGAGGFARVAIVRDGRGNAVEQDFFGPDGKPVLATKLAVARGVTRYDARNLEVDESYYGVDGNPILTKGKGIARQLQLYDKRDDMVYQLYFGLDGKPIWSKLVKGYGIHVRYDATGKPLVGDEMTDAAQVAALAATIR